MKIGSKIGYFSQVDYQEKMHSVVDFFELYLTPDFDFKKIKALKKETVVHVAHQGEGINFANPQKETLNKKALILALEAADFLGSKLIIFHPGYLENSNCTLVAAEKFVSKNYDPRLCVENMPITSSSHRFLCTNPQETNNFIKNTEVGFCLDFAHAYEANEFRPMTNFINEFLALDPQIFHLTDTDLDEIKKTIPQKPSHLSLGIGSLDFRDIIKTIPQNALLTLETPTIAETQIKEIELIKRIS